MAPKSATVAPQATPDHHSRAAPPEHRPRLEDMRSPDPGARARSALMLQRRAGNRATVSAAGIRTLARTQAGTLKGLQDTAGYKALDEATRKRLDALIGGGTSLSTHAWSHMQTLLADKSADLTQAGTFSGFLKGTTWLNFDVRLPGETRLKAAGLTKDAPVDVKAHPYRSGAADAAKTVANIQDAWPDGTPANMSIPIFSPKAFVPYKAGRVLPSADDMATVLAELPLQSRARIKRIDLHPVKNPDDSYWESNKEYNPTGAEFVSHMTAGSDGVIDVFPSESNGDLKELETSLIHETGHVASNSAWGDDGADKRWDAWKSARVADGISVSTYGNSSDQEDVAESWLLFLTSLGTPLEIEVRTLIPNRVKVLEGLLQHNTKPKPPDPVTPSPALQPATTGGSPAATGGTATVVSPTTTAPVGTAVLNGSGGS